MTDLTLQEALDQLNRYTADEVAELLRLADKKGQVQNSMSCPVANYLYDVLGQKCSVGPWKAHNLDLPHYVDDSCWVDLPDGVSDFVGRFDQGKYPFLVTAWADHDNAG